jgi:hypothetical protein
MRGYRYVKLLSLAELYAEWDSDKFEPFSYVREQGTLELWIGGFYVSCNRVRRGALEHGNQEPDAALNAGDPLP